MDRRSLNALLEDRHATASIPGVAAAIVQHGADFWSGAAGVADPGTGEAMESQTVFAIGSMTKSFVAALVLRFVERGLLALDDSVARYLPAGVATNKATIEDLLRHRSGLPEHVTPGFVNRLLKEPLRAWTAEEALGHVDGSAGTRGEFRYSSTNYLLLGMAIEHVTGAPVGAAMSQFLDPLGLDRISYQSTGVAPRPHAVGVTHLVGSAPLMLRGDGGLLPCRSVATAAGAAGGMASDAPSLARWAWLLHRGDALGRESKELLLEGDEHAFGSSRLEVASHEALGHPGRIPGYRGVFAYLPTLDMTCVVLMNTDAEEAQPMDVLTGLVAAVS